MVTLSVAVMHVPGARERRPWVDAIEKTARSNPLVKRFDVVRDFEKRGPWHTGRRAWHMGRSARCTHHMVLQDDALLCDGFFEQAVQAISALPDECISFFAWRGSAQQAADEGNHWVAHKDHILGLALVMPTAWIGTWLQWCADNVWPGCKHDDTRLLTWLISETKQVYFTVPSLVEHLGVKSVTGNNPPIRRTATIYEQQPGEIDWAGSDVTYIRPNHSLDVAEWVLDMNKGRTKAPGS